MCNGILRGYKGTPAHNKVYIYFYAFSRRFYPKRLTVHSGYHFFVSMCVPWELNPQPFALLTQCSTTEPQELAFAMKQAASRHGEVWQRDTVSRYLSQGTRVTVVTRDIPHRGNSNCVGNDTLGNVYPLCHPETCLS